jgi:hypothetical protein
MIISHKHKYTLMRVPKTGSTSLEASVRFCGAVHEDDICSNTEDAYLPTQNLPEQIRKELVQAHRYREIVKQKVKYKFELTKKESLMKKYGRQWDLFMEHNTLDDWINIPHYSKHNLISKKQILEYKHYGFLREPIERYLSSFCFYQMWTSRTEKKPITVEAFHDFTLNELKDHENILFRPQKDYFYFQGKQIAEPLMFKNWSSEASRMIKEIGFHPLKVYPMFKENGGAAKQRPDHVRPLVSDWVDKHSKIKEFIDEYFREDIKFYNQYI